MTEIGNAERAALAILRAHAGTRVDFRRPHETYRRYDLPALRSLPDMVPVKHEELVREHYRNGRFV